ncbi:MAG: amidohydrolase family protein [Candidatus Eisenbacteria bacterium]|nr:amidohydrolase family protein [Candidatus Eisenbacteria bacterium]
MRAATLAGAGALGLILVSQAAAITPIPPKPQARPLAIVGGTVFPVTGPPIENGTVVIENGRISAVTGRMSVPADAEVVDAKGLSVYPGFVSAHTVLGMTEVGSVRQSNDYEEVGALNPNARAMVVLNPDSELLPVARANGVLTALAVPRGGRLSGLSALFHLDGWTFEEMTILSPAALHLQWPAMGVNRAPEAKPPVEEQLAGRARTLAELDQLFADARAYWTARDAATGGAPRVEFDPRWDAMGPVLAGKTPVVVHASDLRQIRAALDWADRQRVRLIIAGGYDAPEAAAELKAREVPVITQGLLAQPLRDWEPYDHAYTLPARLLAQEVTFCISTGGEAANERNLPYHAAMAWSYGLPHDEAMKAITLYPAQILGVGDRLGSLEVGKEGTVCLWDGDPLDIRSHVTRAFIEGREIDLETRHTRFYAKYKDREVAR